MEIQIGNPEVKILPKKAKSWLSVSGEITLALFVKQLLAHVLGYISGYLALRKITKHV